MEEQDEFVVRGPSTRAIRVHGRDHLVGFTREALASVVEQVQSGYVTMSIEHFAGWMNGNDHPVDINLVAFFYHDGVWNLGWWASADSAYLTEWFEKNYPDPRRFLGQPIIGVSEEERQLSRTGLASRRQ